MPSSTHDTSCSFCGISSGRREAHIVYSCARCVAFLDHRPLFHGHVLLVLRQHIPALAQVPADLIEPLFAAAQRVARAVERAMEADGSFIAMNNGVSQSVPHLHIHIVPRRKGDGLRGFFWPRTKYTSDEQMADVAERIRAAIDAPA
jgi:histidine triad (HIT) family protein